MACQAIHSWTFAGLVGAFLDLAIAYLLLCASTLAFFASKFLGFLGLSLPCPCDRIFGTPNSNYCIKKLLVDFPIESVSSIQFSVKGKFPFDSIWAKDENYQLNVKLIRDRNNNVSGFAEIEGEASCSSILGPTDLQNMDERELVLRNGSGRGLDVVDSSLPGKEGRFDLKGKGILNQRPRGGFRRRRKGLTDYAKASPYSSSEPSCANVQSSSTRNPEENKAIECNSVPVDYKPDTNHFNDDEEALVIKDFGEKTSCGFEFNEPLLGVTLFEKNETPFEEINSNVQKELDYEGNQKNAIRILEQALEEEQAARAALYVELEKERSAAATAADEAMAMILRLQEEKASIEMEAWQYQRMIEEKSAYDAEEMNILKEILLRREREKHFLEKEVDAYRQSMCIGDQQLQHGIQDTEHLSSSLDLGLMLQQLSKSTEKREIVRDESSVNEVSSIDKPNYALGIGEELGIPRQDEEADFPKQGDVEELSVSVKTIPVEGEPLEQNDNADQEGTKPKTIETIRIPNDGNNLEQHGSDKYQRSKKSGNMLLDVEPHVHDVHVVDGNTSNKGLVENSTSNGDVRNDLPLNASETLKKDVVHDCSSTSGLDTEPDINRSSSNTTAGLPPLGGSMGKSIVSYMRRKSMSAADNERFKIDTEVEWLREKLRIVQEGREKLNFSMEHREREKLQLQLLENIACQLREIRQLSEPGKAVRQASLPLPSSKVMSKKRRSRSVSLGVHKSS